MVDEHDVDVPENNEQNENHSAEQPADSPSPDANESPPADKEVTPADKEAGESAKGETGDSEPDAAVGVMEEGDASEQEAEAASPESEGENQEKVVNEGDANEDDAEAAMMAMLNDLPQEEKGATPDDISFSDASVSNAEFQQLSQPASKPSSQGIDLLMDINLPVSIELGRTKMAIADILTLGPGSIVELNKLAGEPVDLLVNYKVVARGEVVVVDENFGVRITQLMTHEERLKALGEEQ
ncbi:MAG: flagellar motor switch protein FliN [candidate division Zixibacteria bacterium]|nr:flagellar motor switch protein FliN [candidate division Zixibacteria bacterium]